MTPGQIPIWVYAVAALWSVSVFAMGYFFGWAAGRGDTTKED